MTDNERSLLVGCLEGDKAAWDAFVLQYSSLVYHTIKKTLASYHVETAPHLVEDLFQDVFVALLREDFRKLRQFRGERECSLATWLRLVTSRLTIDFLRNRDSSSLAPLQESFEQPDVPTLVIEREDEEAIARAVGHLAPRERLIIDLCFVRAVPPEEIAAIFRISVSAVYTQKSRILAKLRKILEKAPAL
jgi:RNA polymerase sigma factor (sigma-70 family)